jgi:hypothetical protein
MALKPCRECKKKVSTEAATCPSCGVPNPTTRYSKQTINKKEKSIFVKMFTGYDSEKTSLDKIKTNKKTKVDKPIYEENLRSRTYFKDEKSPVAFLKGDVDLALAYWGYGVIGSMFAGFILIYLSAASIIFLYLFIIVMVGFIIGLWNCASSYNERMKRNNNSTAWGVIVQILCVISSLQLINTIREIL